MEKKQKLFLGFVIIVIMAIFTVAGCDSNEKLEFPSEFRGTWKRETQPYTNTLLTITADTYKISSRSNTWKLTEVSGNKYYIEDVTYGGKGSEVIRYINGKLEIERCGDTGDGNCGGTWAKQKTNGT